MTAAPTPSATYPITVDLDRRMQEALGKIPSTGRGFVTAAVSRDGAEAEVGTHWRAVRVSGYTGRLWGGRGWTAGARASVSW